jgi:hypothetical protein
MKLGIMMLVLSTNNVQGVNMKMQGTNSASSPQIPHPGMHTYHSATFSGDCILLECIAYHSASSLEISMAPKMHCLPILHLLWRFSGPRVHTLL